MPVSMGADARENVNQLVKDLLSHVLIKNNASVEGFLDNSRPSALQTHVRHTVDALIDDSPELFINLGEQLHMTEGNIQVIFIGICDEIFVTGINWGRIVAFLAFGGAVATYCSTKDDLSPYVPQIAVWMTNYIGNNLEEWINRQGGWDGFIRFFRLPGDRDNLLNELDLKNWTMCALAGFGFGALLMFATHHPHL